VRGFGSFWMAVFLPCYDYVQSPSSWDESDGYVMFLRIIRPRETKRTVQPFGLWWTGSRDCN